MISLGLLFALLTTLSWSIGIFPFTQAARRLGINPLNNFRLILAAIIIGVIACVSGFKGFVNIFSSEYLNAWVWLSISGIVGLTIGDHFAFAMYSVLGARIGSVLTTFAPAAALLLGSIIIDEHISFIGIIGMIVTITGVNFVSLGKSEREKIPNHGHGSIAYGIIAGILAALCQGAGLVLAKKGMLSHIEFPVNPVHATFIRLTAASLSLLLFNIVSGRIKEVYELVAKNKNQGLKYAVAGTMFGPVMGVCLSLYTVSFIEPSIAQTIFSLVPAFAFVLAVMFFNEKITLRSMIGLFIAISGVVILIWRDAIGHYIS
jgi:drug/metabolite transporter (DMT)-like permease